MVNNSNILYIHVSYFELKCNILTNSARTLSPLGTNSDLIDMIILGYEASLPYVMNPPV